MPIEEFPIPPGGVGGAWWSRDHHSLFYLATSRITRSVSLAKLTAWLGSLGRNIIGAPLGRHPVRVGTPAAQRRLPPADLPGKRFPLARKNVGRRRLDLAGPGRTPYGLRLGRPGCRDGSRRSAGARGGGPSRGSPPRGGNDRFPLRKRGRGSGYTGAGCRGVRPEADPQVALPWRGPRSRPPRLHRVPRDV